MLIRKSSIVLATSHSFAPFPLSASQSSTSSNPRHRCGTRHQTWCREPQNAYATVAGDAKDSQEQPERPETEHEWPAAPKGQTCPTPYQILDLKQSDTYGKARYFKLVKLYHPDLKNTSKDGLSDQVKMERYRLIVSAHNILSDPVKRSAYDRFGAGWAGRAEVGGQETWSQPSPFHPPGPFTHSWHNDPNDPVWQNATWEDWERWRERRDGTMYSKKPAPVYMANSYFLALIAALAIMGSSLNYNRAQDAGTYFIEQRDLLHDRAAKDLRRVKQDVSTLNSRQGRIDYFVRQREATMNAGDYEAHEALREEKAARVLKDMEVCQSEGVRERGG